MRRSWLLIIGLILGLGLGFLVGWGLWPVQYFDTSPAQLRTDYQDEYLRLVAFSYHMERDLSQARARLTAMGDTAPFPKLVARIEAWMASNGSPEILRLSIELARDLGVDTPAMRDYVQGAEQ